MEKLGYGELGMRNTKNPYKMTLIPELKQVATLAEGQATTSKCQICRDQSSSGGKDSGSGKEKGPGEASKAKSFSNE